MKKGFTMIELIFVIVILGILAAVAIPRLAGTRADAEITTAIANIRTLLSDAATYYVAKGSFCDYRAGATVGNNNGLNCAKWSQFTNVPLFKPDGTASISETDTIIGAAILPVAGKPCISLAIEDPIKQLNSPHSNISTAVVLLGSYKNNNSSLCNAVRNAEAVKVFTENKLLDKDGNPYDFSDLKFFSSSEGDGWTGAIGVGSSASVYDLNFSAK